MSGHIETSQNPYKAKVQENETLLQNALHMLDQGIDDYTKVPFHRTVNDVCHMKLVNRARELGYNAHVTTDRERITTHIYEIDE